MIRNDSIFWIRTDSTIVENTNMKEKYERKVIFQETYIILACNQLSFTLHGVSYHLLCKCYTLFKHFIYLTC